MSEEKNFFYTNSSEVGMSAYDITINFLRKGFGRVDPAKIGQETDTSVSDELTVSMSPSHAKAMAAHLYKTTLDYERQFSEIPLPPEAKAQWSALFGKK